MIILLSTYGTLFVRSLPFNPSTKENHIGFNYHGITFIRHEGARLLKDICLGWSHLFSLAPSTRQLTGDFVMDEN
ncbi:hypothetical protein BBOR36S_02395 [Brevibacillus borstelensis]